MGLVAVGEKLTKCKLGYLLVRLGGTRFPPHRGRSPSGRPKYARGKLGSPALTLEMLASDYNSAMRASLIKPAGFQAYCCDE